MGTFQELNKGSIGGLLERFKNVKVIKTPQPSLFPQLHATWSAAEKTLLFEKHRCPICSTKLRLVPHRAPQRAICAGKRHADKVKFVISVEKLFKHAH